MPPAGGCSASGPEGEKAAPHFGHRARRRWYFTGPAIVWRFRSFGRDPQRAGVPHSGHSPGSDSRSSSSRTRRRARSAASRRAAANACSSIWSIVTPGFLSATSRSYSSPARSMNS